MAIYDILTIDELTEYVVSLAQHLIPDYSFSQGSDNWKRMRAVAGGVGDSQALHLAVLREIMVHTATRDGCVAWARALGVTVQGARGSAGVNAGRLVGTVGTPYTTGATLTHKTQTQYAINETGTIPAAGFVDVDIVAISTGTITNLAAGEVLVFDAPIAGIATDVQLQIALTDGTDEESVGSLRARILERLANPGKGGSGSDWLQWVLEVAPVAEAYVYRHRDGLNTVDVVGMKVGAGSARALTAPERAAVLANLDVKRPTTSTARVLDTVTDPQPVKITITPFPGVANAKDWDDTTPLVVSSWTAGTRTLQFTTARPSDMAAGDRICWDNAGGELSVIASLVSTDSVVLKDTPSVAPSGNVYAGGPLTAQIQTAVKNYVNGWTETLANGDEVYRPGIGPALGDYGAGWDDALRPQLLMVAAARVEGCLFATIDSPAAPYSPADFGYPDDAQTRYVAASYVFVKYAAT